MCGHIAILSYVINCKSTCAQMVRAQVLLPYYKILIASQFLCIQALCDL